MDKNISEYIDRIDIVTGTSKKTGNPYEYIRITFKNGYQVPVFLSSDPLYIIKNVCCK